MLELNGLEAFFWMLGIYIAGLSTGVYVGKSKYR